LSDGDKKQIKYNMVRKGELPNQKKTKKKTIINK